MEFLKFRIFEEGKEIKHFITTREGGVSEAKYHSLNLSYNVPDDIQHVKTNRQILADYIGIQANELVFPDQCHASRIMEVNGSNYKRLHKETDGLITREKGLCLCILAADCVPVILYDPVRQAIAALHAGWRGTYSRIVCRGVERMVRVFGSKPQNILAGIGPAISQLHYEVGEDVEKHFHILFSDYPEIFKKNERTGKAHLDLKNANSILLQRSGVLKEHIEVSSVCTYSSPELLFSARRDGLECGRFATGVMLLH
jgi:YfiH family protein